MKRYIVDRFEDPYAICENEKGDFVNIEKELLPPETKEGDHLYIHENGTYYIDYKATEESRKRIRKKLDSLFE